MAALTTREELLLLLDEIDRGDMSRQSLEDLVDKLNILVSDAEAVEILENDDLDAEEVATQLLGYPESEA